MKYKLLIILVIVGSLVYSLKPDEYYNSLTGNIVCEESCWHEKAHKMDHENGWISKTPEFRIAVDHLVNKDFFSIYYLFDLENGMYAEYYAEVLQAVNGDISLISKDLQQFYLIGR